MNRSLSEYGLPAELREKVDHYRETKIARLDDVLGPVGAEDVFPWGDTAATDLPLRYALAHHVFEKVHRAAREGDPDAVNAAMALRTDQSPLDLLQTASGPILLAHPTWDALVDDAGLTEVDARTAAPVAVVSPELCARASAGDRDLATRALGSATEAGFGATVSRNTRVVALIAELQPDTPRIRSWTTNSLPATAHLDYFAEHRYVSRELIHEAAHSELNDLFAALGTTFPEGAAFYAPWLESERPVFGFLHGTWAFSHVALYCRWLAEADLGPEVSAVADMMRTRYTVHLRDTRDDFARAIRLVPPELAELITQRRDDVLSGAALRP
jgi:HEXXH motif-containing protein